MRPQLNSFGMGMVVAGIAVAAAPCARSGGSTPPPMAVDVPEPLAEAEGEPTPPPTFRTLTHRGRVFHVATLDLGSHHLHMAGQNSSWSHPRTLVQLANRVTSEGEQLLWATNVGIFHEGGRPVGLHVEEGKALSPLNTEDGRGNFFLRPNGAFLVGQSGARIRTTTELVSGLGDVGFATQSGPILLRKGELHPALMAESPNLRLRSGVGVSDAQTVHFAISDGPVRFHELATLFRDELGCADALYLDGVISEWVSPQRPVAGSTRAFSGFFYVTQPLNDDSPRR
ncbi:MAG: phosphodiester glycosidase family protein [Myxococcota bacterium]